MIPEEMVKEGLRLLIENIDDPRTQVLLAAASCVLKNRNASYGEPEDNFRRIARRKQARYAERLKDGAKITAMDSALDGLDIKMGRIEHAPTHWDSWVDAAGYIACAYRCMVVESGLSDMGQPAPLGRLHVKVINEHDRVAKPCHAHAAGCIVNAR